MEQNTGLYIEAGKKMRELRYRKKLSLDTVAKAIGISYQQLQKYEKGTNCISIGKLYQIALFFRVSPAAFFPKDSNKEFETIRRLYKLEAGLSEIYNIVMRVDNRTPTPEGQYE